jgi:DNA (cytosine-5)-methyltransferase 1
MILDLFAGPGGWDEALRQLGRDDVVGVELDAATCATRREAGHKTLEANVASLNPSEFRGWEGLIASPPCQTFSVAGLQRGFDDVRGQLVFEVIRFADAMQPAWIACEEVKEVLPIWRLFAEHLRGFGYFTWAGLLNAADFGVPQSRKRAFLLASRKPFDPPKPTHTQYHAQTLFGEYAQWVTMAEALNMVPDDLEENQKWALERPATTVVRSFCPDVIAAPGYRLAGDGPRQKAPGSIKVTAEQMCVLQGVRTDYPFKGSRTKTLSLIGAFLPPAWAYAVLASVIHAPEICAECGNDQPASGMTMCLDCLGGVA